MMAFTLSATKGTSKFTTSPMDKPLNPILFCSCEKSGKLITYQLFIEPKGKHLKERDRWKEKFLKEITESLAITF